MNKNSNLKKWAAMVMISIGLTSQLAFAGERNTIEVAVTNITNSILFAPVLVASHKGSLDLFETGETGAHQCGVDDASY